MYAWTWDLHNDSSELLNEVLTVLMLTSHRAASCIAQSRQHPVEPANPADADC